MKRIETRAYARAGLVGNPSDGYFGKTLAVSIRDFCAKIVLYDWPTLEILPCEQDQVRFSSLDELALDVRLNGYYGGLRLVKASLKKFHEYCRAQEITLPERNFSIRYESDIPRQVGLAGSSAIVTATFRALMSFYEIAIPNEILPNWILATERDELGIAAGLQDRVCQTYEGLVFMDFNRRLLETRGYGEYQRLDASLLPNLFLAYRTELSQESGVTHSDLRARWEHGDEEVVSAMQDLADLTEAARDCLLANRGEKLGAIMDANTDLRFRIMKVSDDNRAMIEAAHACGAAANFSGSGGAIIGQFADKKMLVRLKSELRMLGCRVLQPRLQP